MCTHTYMYIQVSLYRSGSYVGHLAYARALLWEEWRFPKPHTRETEQLETIGSRMLTVTMNLNASTFQTDSIPSTDSLVPRPNFDPGDEASYQG